MKGLTFEALRRANTERLPLFKNSKGDPAHAMRDGSDWSRSDWLEAILGELGEYANKSKKERSGGKRRRAALSKRARATGRR